MFYKICDRKAIRLAKKVLATSEEFGNSNKALALADVYVELSNKLFEDVSALIRKGHAEIVNSESSKLSEKVRTEMSEFEKDGYNVSYDHLFEKKPFILFLNE